MADRKTNNETVVGVFLDEQYARRAIQALQAAGFSASMADESAIRSFRNVGLEDDVISLYRDRYAEGNTIVTANAGTRGDEVLGIMLQNGAEYINLSGKGQVQQSTTRSKYYQGQGYNTDYYRKLGREQRQYGYYDDKLGRARNADEIKVELREESLTPVKQAVQTGEVGVHKTVREEQHEVPINLRHEEVVVERHAVDRPADPSEIGDMREETMSVPVYEERADLQKQARVYEEVTLRKEGQEEQRTVTGTTRREELDVTQSGDVALRGTGTDSVRTGESWTEVMPTYRTRWEQSHRGARWEEAEPAYRYAYDMRNNPKYRGRSYSEIESDLRNEWKNRGEPTAWDRVSTTVRDAWNDLTT
jgi:uncharacterized protein (TIGR02271 family)